jgi:hypothetical protein
VISFDGSLTLSEIRDLAISEGFGAVFLTEHIEHLQTSDLRRLIDECHQFSTLECVLIPGLEIEAQCQYFLGLSHPVPTDDPAETRRQLISSGSVPVLAHPHRLKRTLSEEERAQVRAVEIWNVKDDGGRAPGYVGYRTWRNWAPQSSRPAPIAGVDLHQLAGFRPIGIEVNVDHPSANILLEAVRKGNFRICREGAIVTVEPLGFAPRCYGFMVYALRRIYRSTKVNRIVPGVMSAVGRRFLKG